MSLHENSRFKKFSTFHAKRDAIIACRPTASQLKHI